MKIKQTIFTIRIENLCPCMHAQSKLSPLPQNETVESG